MEASGTFSCQLRKIGVMRGNKSLTWGIHLREWYRDAYVLK